MLRWDPVTSSGYQLSLNYLAIYRWDNGVRTGGNDTFGPTGAVNTWETYAFIADTNGTLTIKNAAGTVLLTWNDTTYTANTGVGIFTFGRYGDAWGEIDNWHVGTYAPVTTTPVSASRSTTWNAFRHTAVPRVGPGADTTAGSNTSATSSRSTSLTIYTVSWTSVRH